MASIRKRVWKNSRGEESTAWVVSYVDGDGKARLKTFHSKKEADRGRLQIETDIDLGTHVVAAETMTFARAAEFWLVDCDRRHKSMGSPAWSTIKSYESLLKTKLLPTFGKIMMTNLKGEAVQDWLNLMSKQHAFDTLRQFRLIFSLIIKFCIKTNRLKRNVLTDQQVRLPGLKSRIVIPSREQIGKLLGAMEERQKCEQMLSFMQRRAFISLALFGGLRAGEICGLQWEFVDFEAGVLQIRHSFSHINGMKGPKTKAGIRDVPLVPLVSRALVELREYCGNPEGGFVFMTKSGENMRKSFDNIIWRPVMGKAGMTGPCSRPYKYGRPLFHFHSLRHAAVSLLISEGVNGLHIASFVGHANVNTTMGIYGHLFPEDTRVKNSLTHIAGRFGPVWDAPKPIDH